MAAAATSVLARGARRRRRRRHSSGVLGAAVRGAIAGVAGGLAMIGARELEQLAVAEPVLEQPRRKPASRRAATRMARTIGVELSTAQGESAGVVLQLATAAAVGAVYGVARSYLPVPRGADAAILGGIVYLANAWGVMPAAGLLALPPGQTLEEALVPVGTHAVFGVATARVFELLEDV